MAKRLLYPADLRWVGLSVGLAAAAALTLMLTISYDQAAGLRAAAAMLLIVAVQDGFVAWLRWRIGPERPTLADALTFCRAAAAMVLAGLVASSVRDRQGIAGWVGWAAMALGATVCDWLDGPLARRLGPTRAGGALDIEADSWITLWSAAAAVAWGGLPWWALVAPLIRYAHPVLDVLAGGLPTGGGPWWGRVTGTAQMALFFAALAPVDGPHRDATLQVAAVPIALAQCGAMLVMLWQRRSAPPFRGPAPAAPGS
jgi:phosphatidylglycerophosphate synthase